ncbi:3'(2'),5'-bisphosphate nucleotidase CysQ [Panacibacter ginsenosidivorans]|uniref:3'(2'),5'-bisphosphate nucleotidase CysQ n=1 Tax=Panacibacter ginsenosidivorans TaxID=1813871 RepID=A0A5B8VDR4_9BACT|nr:3'(2'),5'-bisphosphate nucleotidase CysQ [Panacibacter ginsenosidivorans]QEC69195.1 3'(2'),5'-bisphosphate nucleotidase CysQ [Panacibacter ginsenosidivorans]
MTDVQNLLEIAKYAALDAGKAVMEIYRSGEFETDIKTGASPVTKADKISHTIITGHLDKTHLPVLSEEGGHIDFKKRKQWEYFWLIDPLDGTKEFINKNGEFTINIAFVRQNTAAGGVIYAPCNDTLYSGSKETGAFKNEKGSLVEFPPLAERVQFKDLLQREHITVIASRSHVNSETMTFIKQFQSTKLMSLGSSLKFMLLLENRADIYPRLGATMEWDTAAAHAILNASNRGVYQADMKSELCYNKPDLTNPFFIAF